MYSILDDLSKDQIQSLIDSKDTVKAILENIGLQGHGANYKTFWNKVKSVGLDSELIKIKLANSYKERKDYRGKIPQIPLDKVLVEDSPHSNKHLKPRLVASGLFEEKCSKCGIGNIWQNEPITLQLDHINGNNKDNRINNLRILCPNCHSQTQTYGGRNAKKPKKYCFDCKIEISKYSKDGRCRRCTNIKLGINRRKITERPAIEELTLLINDLGYEAVGRKYGVSGNAIRKWLI